ncbi:large ribosomal subunit protein uL29m [Rhineura floridana]|uniref:large ribosomal subunit protein uL29m n=1 Tax=Rhineura floridana TaxID=261503 RepID=UPI002AC84D31|nr:large ribosomal subunit protein uL29m [Rhineura floridana]
MAAAALCRPFSKILRLTGVTWGAPATSSSRLILNNLHKNATKVEIIPPCTLLHTSLPQNGLEEFFDDPQNWGKPEVKSGDSWTVEQLRGKNSEDLHKLWYVLLKERNMLLTLEQEAKRQRLPMPSPERLEKVKDSMERMDLVIQEREDALRLLQTGQEKEMPGEWRTDFLGRTFWYTFKEWPIPWYLNKHHNRKRFYYLPRINRFLRLRFEKYLRKETKKRNLQKQQEKRLQEKFPHLKNATQSQS